MTRWKAWFRSGLWVALFSALLLSLTVRLSAEQAATFEQALEPEAIRSAVQEATAGLSGRPRLMDLAFVAAEDRDFFDEFPAWSMLTGTIARWYPPREDDRGIKRHLRELQVSVALANALEHDEILAWYMARIYLGRGCYGFEAASVVYFGTIPEKLRLERIALLAALPKAPTMYDPARRPEKALERRNFLLTEMSKAGFVTEAVAQMAAE